MVKTSKEKEQLHILLSELPYTIITEFQFDKFKNIRGKRKWCFDYYIAKYGIGIEYEGIRSKKSGHTTLKGYSEDCEKYNRASSYGFRLLRYTLLFVSDPETILSDINRTIENVKKYQKFSEKCILCKDNLYINPCLWIEYKKGYICHECLFTKKLG